MNQRVVWQEVYYNTKLPLISISVRHPPAPHPCYISLTLHSIGKFLSRNVYTVSYDIDTEKIKQCVSSLNHTAITIYSFKNQSLALYC